MFIAPAAVVRATTSEDMAVSREQAKTWRSEGMGIPDRFLTDESLADLSEAAKSLGNETFVRTIAAVQAARKGDYGTIPSIESAEALFKQFLADDKIDGWVYVQEEDGYLHPYLVADIKFEHADISRDARVKITMEADSPTVQRPSKTPRLLLLEDSAIVGKTPEQALTAQGAFHETQELKAAYQKRRDVYQDIIDNGFAQQFMFTGTAIRTEDHKSPKNRTNRKVVQDVKPGSIAPLRTGAP